MRWLRLCWLSKCCYGNQKINVKTDSTRRLYADSWRETVLFTRIHDPVQASIIDLSCPETVYLLSYYYSVLNSFKMKVCLCLLRYFLGAGGTQFSDCEYTRTKHLYYCRVDCGVQLALTHPYFTMYQLVLKYPALIISRGRCLADYVQAEDPSLHFTYYHCTCIDSFSAGSTHP